MFEYRLTRLEKQSFCQNFGRKGLEKTAFPENPFPENLFGNLFRKVSWDTFFERDSFGHGFSDEPEILALGLRGHPFLKAFFEGISSTIAFFNPFQPFSNQIRQTFSLHPTFVRTPPSPKTLPGSLLEHFLF
jgi:hypothetical protein